MKKTEFEHLVNPYLLEIASLRLDWLLMEPLLQAHWLAEDKLGFTWILVFVYGRFFANIKLRDNSNTLPGALLVMRQMIVSMWVMLVLLMSPRNARIELIDRHIKVFLSCCHLYPQLFYVSGTIPFCATTCNFPSSLNLSAQIKKNGPIRWYWEGTRERYIQNIKKESLSMRKITRYFIRKFEFMQKLDTLAWLKEKRNQKKKERITGECIFRYESLEDINQNLTMKKYYWVLQQHMQKEFVQ